MKYRRERRLSCLAPGGPHARLCLASGGLTAQGSQTLGIQNVKIYHFDMKNIISTIKIEKVFSRPPHSVSPMWVAIFIIIPLHENMESFSSFLRFPF
jgi:hypothetical protein